MNILLRLSGTTFVVSILFKIMHWPMASIALLVSWAFAMAAAGVKLYKAKPTGALDVTLFVALAGLVTGYVFKWMHWPFADLLMSAGALVGVAYLALGGASRLSKGLQELRSGTASRLTFGLAASISILGILFKKMHWPYASILILISAICWLAWLWIGMAEKHTPRLGVLDEEI